MNPCFQHYKHQVIIEHILQPLPRAAAVSPEGQAVFIKYESLADIGTLPATAQTCHQYFPLGHGDIIICNDPYSGGSALSSMTLVMGLCEPKGGRKKSADLLISMRLPFKPQLTSSSSVESEGLRIPPTPLFQNGQLNGAIVEAMASHPSAPYGFTNAIESTVEKLVGIKKHFTKLCSQLNVDFSKPQLKKTFQSANHMMKQLLGEVTVGESHSEVVLDDGARIKLKLDIREDKVVFDFSGSDDSTYLHLTDTATFGACVGALVSLFDKPIPLNAGVFETVEVMAPSGSLVNAKYPMPVFLGMTDGAGIIANLVLKAVGEIDHKRNFAMSGVSQCSFDIKFSGNRHFYETLETGLAATSDQKGVGGLNLWKRSHLDPCLEEVERRYPIEIQTYSFRTNSGGSGAKSGGDGITKAIKVTEDATLAWLIAESQQKPEGAEGGKHGSTTEIYIHRKGSGREKLPFRGELNLRAGDIVTLHSAGGGGFGEE